MRRLTDTLQRGAVAVVACFLAGAAYADVYCPWADTVVRLRIADDLTAVTIVSTGLTNVPKPGIYVSTPGTGREGAAVFPVTVFSLVGAGYTYVFEVEERGYGVRLNNTRIRNTDGRTFSQSGWCLVER